MTSHITSHAWISHITVCYNPPVIPPCITLIALITAELNRAVFGVEWLYSSHLLLQQHASLTLLPTSTLHCSTLPHITPLNPHTPCDHSTTTSARNPGKPEKSSTTTGL